MSDVQIETAIQSEVVLTVLMHLKKGKIRDAAACFADEFQFNDLGIRLEFKDRERLAEFFQKTQELYPDSWLQTARILVIGDHVIIQWILHTDSTEPFFGGLSRKVPISLHGASIMRVENGKIKEWSDYYDGLTARRNSLAAHFEEWVELWTGCMPRAAQIEGER